MTELEKKIKEMDFIAELSDDQVLEVMNWEQTPGVSEDITDQFNRIIKNQRKLRDFLLAILKRQEELERAWSKWLENFKKGSQLE